MTNYIRLIDDKIYKYGMNKITIEKKIIRVYIVNNNPRTIIDSMCNPDNYDFPRYIKHNISL